MLGQIVHSTHYSHWTVCNKCKVFKEGKEQRVIFVCYDAGRQILGSSDSIVQKPFTVY